MDIEGDIEGDVEGDIEGAGHDAAADIPAALRAAVGRRVVVRYRLGGGPQRTDVLGTLRGIEADGTLVVLADRDGTVRRLPASDVIAGKPVPQRTIRGGPSR